MPDMMDKFKELLSFASKMDPLPSEYRTEVNRVHGCVARVSYLVFLRYALMIA